MFEIQDSDREVLRKLLARYLPDCEARVFGSRVKGNARPYSDVDILLISLDKIPLSRLNRLIEALQESSLPFRVDLTDSNRTTPSFMKSVLPGSEKL